MPATTFTIALEQGVPYIQDFIVKNTDNTLKDLTGYTARMQFREFISSPIIYLNATTENSKLFINVSASAVTINLTESDTISLDKDTYVYDLELVSSSGIPIRMIQGKVKVSQEVTR